MLTILRTDAGLVAQVMAGRPNRFDELVRRHFNVVYGIAFSYTRNHADAEDLSQEAFLKAYQSLNTLQEPKKFGHWVSVIARNLSRSWYMRRRRESEVLAQVKSEGPDRNEAAYDDMREVLE
ncbi:MAG: sigma-70 family RNA polymerase sigma factor [Candidatus Hydrogenedentota bacterium]